MSDLISRQVAQRLFGTALVFKERTNKLTWTTAEMKQWIADFIEDLPAAELPTKCIAKLNVSGEELEEMVNHVIIRCKECKHYRFTDNRAFGYPVKRCEWTGFEDIDDEDFCSRAERRPK